MSATIAWACPQREGRMATPPPKPPMCNIVLKRASDMKQIIASLSISACLLLPSAGVVLADNPHTSPLFTGAAGPGQPGTNNGITCNTTTTVPGGGTITVGGGPGGSASGGGSAFNTGTS